MKTQDPFICRLQETLFRYKDTHTDWSYVKRYFMQVETKRKWVAILTSDKLDFKTKTIIRDKEGHYIITKASIKQKDITFINNYTPNVGTFLCKIYKADINRPRGKNRQQCNNSMGF